MILASLTMPPKPIPALSSHGVRVPFLEGVSGNESNSLGAPRVIHRVSIRLVALLN